MATELLLLIMAEKPGPTEFVYHNIELYKSESLGSGSYGGVCKAKCDGLLCAAKIMHPTLFDLRDAGTVSYLSKFREECHLLSLARHPNVVQYLGTFTDPDTQLPILLMELCEESLTAFLERSPGPLPYHSEVNICHDIALALVYLHSNGLIHRDLTGNNVLMISGSRAKITDFGMSKLTSVNPRMSALTLCPGNVLYMSPEALDEAKSYTAKLDIFSFGVIVIQILTRQFPNPTDRFRSVSSSKNRKDEETKNEDDESSETYKEVREVVPETECREAHLKLIPETHSLKSMILQCLKMKERRRPSALELSERVFEVIQTSQYGESRHKAECNQCTQHQKRISELQSTEEDKVKELREKSQQLQTNRTKLLEKEREHKAALIAKVREHQFALRANEVRRVAIQRVIASKEEALERYKKELHSSEELLSDFQQSVQKKDNTIADLQRIISAHERKIHQLELQNTASSEKPHLEIGNMKWKKGKNSPEPMVRGASVVHGNITYIRPRDSIKVYFYLNTQTEELWFQLPDNHFINCGLVVINGLLTSVGGVFRCRTNLLLSLKEEDGKKKWCEIYPRMPMKEHTYIVCVTSGDTLVVAGGQVSYGGEPSHLQVMNIKICQWSFMVSYLPREITYPSAAVMCGNTLFILGAYTGDLIDWSGEPESVFSCSLPDLLSSDPGPSSAFCDLCRRIRGPPKDLSTLVSFNGDLLAIATNTIYKYDSHTDSWNPVLVMKTKRHNCCFAASLPGNCLIIVGGGTKETDILLCD